jgi:hypothetical protein
VQFDGLIGKAFPPRAQFNQDTGRHLETVSPVRAGPCGCDCPGPDDGFDCCPRQQSPGGIGHRTCNNHPRTLVGCLRAQLLDATSKHYEPNEQEREKVRRETSRHRNLLSGVATRRSSVEARKDRDVPGDSVS